MEGYQFLCFVLMTIAKANNHERENYKEHYFNLTRFSNSEKNTFVNAWDRFSNSAITISDDAKRIHQFYMDLVANTKQNIDKFDLNYSDYKSYIGTKDKTLSNKLGNVIYNLKGPNPDLKYGLSLTIAAAYACDCINDDFYVGRKEVQTLLNTCMNVLGYRNLLCIPNTYFEEKEMTSNILFISLYHTLDVLYPQRDDLKVIESNKKKSKLIFDYVFHQYQDERSLLLKQIHRLSEVEKFIETMKKGYLTYCSYDYGFQHEKTKIEDLYTLPHIQSEHPLYSLLKHDRNYHIESFVEGHKSIGKSAIVKMIVLSCFDQLKMKDAKTFKKMIGLTEEDHYLPLVLNCHSLASTAIDDLDIIRECVNQCYEIAQEELADEQLCEFAHYQELQPFIINYFKNKAAAKELFIIVDEFHRLDDHQMKALIDNLTNLRKEYKNYHLLILSQKVKPRIERMIHNLGWSYFKMNDFIISEDLLTRAATYLQVDPESFIKNFREDFILSEFIKTPKLFIDYISFYDHSMLAFLNEMMNEEYQKVFDDVSDIQAFYQSVCVALLHHANPQQRERFIPDHLESLGMECSDKQEELWKKMKQCRVFVERSSTSINDYTFENKFYFCVPLVNHFMYLLSKYDSEELYGKLISYFSKLLPEEFAYVIYLFFVKLNEHLSYRIREDNLLVFIDSLNYGFIKQMEADEKNDCYRMMTKMLEDQDILQGFCAHHWMNSYSQLCAVCKKFILIYDNNVFSEACL